MAGQRNGVGFAASAIAFALAGLAFIFRMPAATNVLIHWGELLMIVGAILYTIPPEPRGK